MTTDYAQEIQAAAEHHGLSANLLTAQVLVESAGKTDAFRFEPNILQQIQQRTLKPKRLPSNPAGRRIASSYGLLQVLYITACEYGFTDEPELLFVPSIGLQYGCLVLEDLLQWADGDYTRALAAYNGGKGGNMSPPFRNQAYADKVLTQARTMGAAV